MRRSQRLDSETLRDLDSQRRSLLTLSKQLVVQRDKAQKLLSDTKTAKDIAQTVAQGIQQRAHQNIANVVSRCLEAIFDDPPQFKIHFERKRNRTEARLVFVRNDHEVDPLSSDSGGVVDVAAFALRLACLLLSRPKLRPIIVLDEPFRALHADIRPRVKTLLEELSKELKVQIILVTHDEALGAGTIIELGNE